MGPDDFGINNLPDNKISKALWDFAQPLIDQINENTTKKQIEKGVMTLVAIWNAVVQDSLNKDDKYVDMLRHRMNNPTSLRHLETYVNRKNRYFSQDLRMISNFKIKYNNGYLNIEATGTVDSRILRSIPKH